MLLWLYRMLVVHILLNCTYSISLHIHIMEIQCTYSNYSVARCSVLELRTMCQCMWAALHEARSIHTPHNHRHRHPSTIRIYRELQLTYFQHRSKTCEVATVETAWVEGFPYTSMMYIHGETEWATDWLTDRPTDHRTTPDAEHTHLSGFCTVIRGGGCGWMDEFTDKAQGLQMHTSTPLPDYQHHPLEIRLQSAWSDAVIHPRHLGLAP